MALFEGWTPAQFYSALGSAGYDVDLAKQGIVAKTGGLISGVDAEPAPSPLYPKQNLNLGTGEVTYTNPLTGAPVDPNSSPTTYRDWAATASPAPQLSLLAPSGPTPVPDTGDPRMGLLASPTATGAPPAAVAGPEAPQDLTKEQWNAIINANPEAWAGPLGVNVDDLLWRDRTGQNSIAPSYSGVQPGALTLMSNAFDQYYAGDPSRATSLQGINNILEAAYMLERQDPAGFQQWATSNPEWAFRYFDRERANGRLTNQEATARSYAVADAAGLPLKEDGRYLITNTQGDIAQNIQNTWGPGDIMDVGTYQSPSNQGGLLGDWARNIVNASVEPLDWAFGVDADELINNPAVRIGTNLLAPGYGDAILTAANWMQSGKPPSQEELQSLGLSFAPYGGSLISGATGVSPLVGGAGWRAGVTAATGGDLGDAARNAGIGLLGDVSSGIAKNMTTSGAPHSVEVLNDFLPQGVAEALAPYVDKAAELAATGSTTITDALASLVPESMQDWLYENINPIVATAGDVRNQLLNLQERTGLLHGGAINELFGGEGVQLVNVNDGSVAGSVYGVRPSQLRLGGGEGQGSRITGTGLYAPEDLNPPEDIASTPGVTRTPGINRTPERVQPGSTPWDLNQPPPEEIKPGGGGVPPELPPPPENVEPTPPPIIDYPPPTEQPEDIEPLPTPPAEDTGDGDGKQQFEIWDRDWGEPQDWPGRDPYVYDDTTTLQGLSYTPHTPTLQPPMILPAANSGQPDWTQWLDTYAGRAEKPVADDVVKMAMKQGYPLPAADASQATWDEWEDKYMGYLGAVARKANLGLLWG